MGVARGAKKHRPVVQKKGVGWFLKYKAIPDSVHSVYISIQNVLVTCTDES